MPLLEVSNLGIRLQTQRGPADAVRDVTTIDYYTGKPVTMPIGIVDLGVPGLRVPAPSGQLDPRCRSGLLRVDGRDVPITLHGTVADALADKPIAIAACRNRPMPLRAGRSPSWCSSTLPAIFRYRSASRTTGCDTSSTVRHVSIRRYTTRMRCSKNGGRWRQVR